MASLMFIKRSLRTLTIGLLLAAITCPLYAVEEKQGDYTIGLSMYSLRKLISDGELTALDYPAFVKKTFGITEIDVWEGLFPENKKNDPAFFKELKKRSDKAGTHIFLVMTGAVDATGKTPEARKAGGDAFRPAVDTAVILGAQFVRIFLKAPEGKRNDAIQHSIEALTPLADYAKEKGVTLVIEPGSSKWAREGRFLAVLAKKMQHPACHLMPDFGKLSDPYCGTYDMMPYSLSISAKSYDFDENGDERHFNYFRLIRSINDFNFNRIIAIEYEGTKMSPVDGVRATQKLLQKYQAKKQAVRSAKRKR